ncbi:MAG TPA: ribosome-inactivating family protein, partial [Chthoniobacterales bacterium]
MNLAYSSVESPDGSLYTLGFANAHGIYRFDINPWPQTLPAMPGTTALNGVKGSYGSLGYSLTPLPTITMQILKNAVIALANYGAAGGPQIADIKAPLALLIIAVSEAARISSVAQGVAGAIAGTPYTAQMSTLRSWGGQTLSN